MREAPTSSVSTTHWTSFPTSDDLLAGGFERRRCPTTRCVEVVSDEHNWPVSYSGTERSLSRGCDAHHSDDARKLSGSSAQTAFTEATCTSSRGLSSGSVEGQSAERSVVHHCPGHRSSCMEHGQETLADTVLDDNRLEESEQKFSDSTGVPLTRSGSLLSSASVPVEDGALTFGWTKTVMAKHKFSEALCQGLVDLQMWHADVLAASLAKVQKDLEGAHEHTVESIAQEGWRAAEHLSEENAVLQEELRSLRAPLAHSGQNSPSESWRGGEPLQLDSVRSSVDASSVQVCEVQSQSPQSPHSPQQREHRLSNHHVVISRSIESLLMRKRFGHIAECCRSTSSPSEDNFRSAEMTIFEESELQELVEGEEGAGDRQRSDCTQFSESNRPNFQMLRTWDEHLRRSRGCSTNSAKSEFQMEVPQWEALLRVIAAQDLKATSSLWRYVMVSPLSTYRLMWDLMGMALIGYDIIVLPMQVFEFRNELFFQGMARLALVFWTLEIVFSFVTGHFQPQINRIEMRPRQVAWIYMRSWFFADLMVVVPEWIILAVSLSNSGSGSAARVGKVLRAMKVARLLRLVRLAKLRRIVAKTEKLLNNEHLVAYINLGKLMLSIAVLNHIVACGWYGMSKMASEEGWADIPLYADSSVLYRYLTSLHWALSMFQGSVEVYPRTTAERAYAVGVSFLGLVVVSYFISSITHFMTQIQTTHAATNQRRFRLLRYLYDNNISSELSVRVKQFVETVSQTQRTTDRDVELLGTLPESMRLELDCEIKGPVLLIHPLLNNLAFDNELLGKKLAHVITQKSMHHGQPLFVRNAESNQMYILRTGRLLYLRAHKWHTLGECTVVPPTIVEAGHYMSEMALWAQWLHGGDCTAGSSCDVFALSSGDLELLLQDFGSKLLRVAIYARQYVLWMNRIDPDIDDLSVKHGSTREPSARERSRSASFSGASRRSRSPKSPKSPKSPGGYTYEASVSVTVTDPSSPQSRVSFS